MIGVSPGAQLAFAPPSVPRAALALVVIWMLCWKGAAMWRAARAGQAGWFAVLFLLPTLGVLEIVYLLFFAPSHHAAAASPARHRGPVPQEGAWRARS